MSKAQLIAKTFDLQRRSRLCNITGCGRMPAKKVTLLEENRITTGSRVLVTLYLCSEHYSTRLPAFLMEINTLRETGKVIGKRVQEMGFITH